MDDPYLTTTIGWCDWPSASRTQSSGAASRECCTAKSEEANSKPQTEYQQSKWIGFIRFQLWGFVKFRERGRIGWHRRWIVVREDSAHYQLCVNHIWSCILLMAFQLNQTSLMRYPQMKMNEEPKRWSEVNLEVWGIQPLGSMYV